MAKLNGNESGKGFDKKPQNINRTGLNRKPSFAQYFEQIGDGCIEFEVFKIILEDGSILETPQGSKALIELANDHAKAMKISEMAFKDVRWFEVEAKLRGLYQPIQIEEVKAKPQESFANLNDTELIVMAKVKRLVDESIGENISLESLSVQEKVIYLSLNLRCSS
jgi:hypothetical protein